jgi:uncharacterized protein YegJ (DUF2314 family)
MKEPDFEVDGWCLEDGEERHRVNPHSFWIPNREDRERLRQGDLAKLIFRISLNDEAEPVATERMWVIVREHSSEGYIGVLDNEPRSISENEWFWRGTEVPFKAQHVIDILIMNEKAAETAL